MATVEEVVAMARSVRERANDLRALEILGVSPESPSMGGMPISIQDVNGWNDTGTERWARWNDRYGLDMQEIDYQRFGAEFDYIPGMFEQLAFGDVSDYNDVLAQLDAASKTLCESDTEFNIESTSLKQMQALDTDWVGSFPDAYRTRFANKLPNLIPEQKQIIQELAAAVKGHWNIVEAGRQSLLSIATQTEAALSNAMGQYAQATVKADLMAVLQMTGAILAIAGSVIAGPTGPLAVSTAIVGSLNQAGSLATTAFGLIELESSVEKTETPIEGSTVEQIIASMHGAITVLQLQVAAEEDDQANRLAQTYGSVEAQLAKTDLDADDSFVLQAYRPAIADEMPKLGSNELRYNR
ncbi:hypothetical protein FB566_3015 [Stackebrandtia endophytica]|uniref:Uncharacterized protein n=1 Tax=Stackebrandtia endophytica TaxID=1496996 RepID=A0A543AY10_9ACTN|nr:hypothetical protein [Stackebrandtia endophytica]TQL77456.1 hypothetical protein FB566_3015 [Stackebrandtia endophytica]